MNKFAAGIAAAGLLLVTGLADAKDTSTIEAAAGAVSSAKDKVDSARTVTSAAGLVSDKAASADSTLSSASSALGDAKSKLDTAGQASSAVSAVSGGTSLTDMAVDGAKGKAREAADRAVDSAKSKALDAAGNAVSGTDLAGAKDKLDTARKINDAKNAMSGSSSSSLTDMAVEGAKAKARQKAEERVTQEAVKALTK